MVQKNLNIRNEIQKNDLRYWQVAERLNLNDGNFSRLLRKELSEEKTKEIFKIIKELKEENKNARI